MRNISHLIRAGQSAVLLGDLETYQTVTRLIGKTIRDLSEQQRIDEALNLEAVWYQNLVKQIECEENYFQAFRWHKESAFAAGFKIRRQFKSSDSEKIAFVIPNGVLLGHTQVLLKVIQDWRQQFLPATISVISLTDFSKALADRLGELSVNTYAAGSNRSSPSNAISWCRDKIENLKCNVAVWVSVPTWASYALGVGLAPKQVFWSLKFHPIHVGMGVNYIAMTPPGEGKVQINGASWWRYSPPLSIGWRRRSEEEIRRLRDSLGDYFLFGSIARTEKFNSEQFVLSVAKIIESCKGSKFVYTGAQDSKVIRKVFADHGLSESAIYVGWVDTELYSQAIDVFLETFPFGCGITGAQAVDAGTTTVSLWGNETLPRFYFRGFLEAAKACKHWLVSSNQHDYIKSAIQIFKSAAAADKGDRVLGVLSKLDAAKSERLYRLIFN
jgi:hypothetical protein